jgi:hypothetical protein
MGNKSVRSLLVQAAILFIRWSPPDNALRQWALALELRRGRLPSRVALARKLAVVMLTIWKNRAAFDFRTDLSVAEALETNDSRTTEKQVRLDAGLVLA